MVGAMVDICWSVTIVLGFHPTPIYVGFVVDKVALGQASLRRLRFSHVSTILLLLPERQMGEIDGPSKKVTLFRKLE